MLILSTGDIAKGTEFLNDHAKIKKAALKAGCSDAHVQAFLDALKKASGSIRGDYLSPIWQATAAKMVGNDLLINHLENHKKLKKLFTAAVLKPQIAVLNASFDLSIHLKGNNLELWLSHKKAGKTILLTVPAPKA